MHKKYDRKKEKRERKKKRGVIELSKWFYRYGKKTKSAFLSQGFERKIGKRKTNKNQKRGKTGGCANAKKKFGCRNFETMAIGSKEIRNVFIYPIPVVNPVARTLINHTGVGSIPTQDRQLILMNLKI